MSHEPEATVATISGCVVLWGLVSDRFKRWDVTGPIAFLVLGLVLSNGPLAVIHPKLSSSTIRSVAELTLALVLFADASRINVRASRADAAIPVRLLGVGLPLTVAAGAAVATGLYGWSRLALAATIGAIVAPTDAALGASVIQDERVPAGVRRILNVESGLNDGIVTPFVNLFLAAAIATEAVHRASVGRAAIDLLGGAAIGAGVGAAGALLVLLARRMGWSEPGVVRLSVFALALFGYSAALLAGTNGFVAVFIAGAVFGTVMDGVDVLSFAEESGNLLSLVVWFAFGAVMVVPGFRDAGWRDLVFAILALTLVRMAPVALALAGARCDRSTVAFIGWFGPRGLASVVFGLIAVDSLAPADARVVIAAVTITVTLSVVAHGVSASPLARRYGTHAHSLGSRAPEHRTTGTVPPARRLTGSRREPNRSVGT
jgi:sodium/hydrogen antiporter